MHLDWMRRGSDVEECFPRVFWCWSCVRDLICNLEFCLYYDERRRRAGEEQDVMMELWMDFITNDNAGALGVGKSSNKYLLLITRWASVVWMLQIQTTRLSASFVA